MGSGREYSRHQEGIIRRYYEHRDTITLQKLGEIVSDLYMAPSERKAAALWKSAAAALDRCGVEPTRAKRITEARDVKALAQLVGELQG